MGICFGWFAIHDGHTFQYLFAFWTRLVLCGFFLFDFYALLQYAVLQTLRSRTFGDRKKERECLELLSILLAYY